MRRATASVFLSVLCGLARADRVETHDGRRLEGKIVEEREDRIVVETPFGRAEIPRALVRSIERGPTPGEEFDARKGKARSAEDHYALGLFARGKGMGRQAREAFEEAARLDPSHEGANRALGRVLFEGKWVSPADRARLAAEREEEAFRARGLVLHGGRWMSPEEKEALEKGLVLHEGRWVPEAEAMAARGLVRRDGRWIPRALDETLAAVDRASEATGAALRAHATERFVVAGPYEETFLGEIGEGAERVFAHFERLFGPGAGREALRGAAGALYVFEDGETYKRAVPHFAAGTTTVGPAWVEYAKGANGFVLYEPTPVSVAARLGRERAALVDHTLHHVGHFLLNRRGANGRLLPPWYDEGFACLVEFAAVGANLVFCRAPAAAGGGTFTPRGGKGEGKPDPNRLATGLWRQEFRRAVDLRLLPPLERVLRREVSELSLAEILYSMAIVERIAEGGSRRLGALHAALRRRMPPAPRRTLDSDGSRALHDAAFLEALGSGVGEVEADLLTAPASAPASAPAPPKRRPPR